MIPKEICIFDSIFRINNKILNQENITCNISMEETNNFENQPRSSIENHQNIDYPISKFLDWFLVIFGVLLLVGIKHIFKICQVYALKQNL